jgi:hypothetical protein
MRWTSLLLRGLGGLVAVVGLVESLLTLASSQELSAVQFFHRRVTVHADVQAVLLDVFAWMTIAVIGFLMLVLARPAVLWLARIGSRLEGRRASRWLGRVLLLGAAVHLLTLTFAVPWPHRFSATALLVGTVVWLVGRRGDTSDRARRILMRILPETQGRGVWGTAARRRLIERLVSEGEAGRLMDGATHLVISACDLASGKICHFINWPNPSEAFRARIAAAMGEVVPVTELQDVLRAALASSAIPLVFEPVRLHGRDYVDPGAFSNQPIHVAIADDAEAVLVVLLSPSAGPGPMPHEQHLVELGGRLLELASWREIQGELRALPPEWTREPNRTTGEPAHVCVVEPDRPLPGAVLGFDPAQASLLMQHGESDAWRALERAGWLDPE